MSSHTQSEANNVRFSELFKTEQLAAQEEAIVKLSPHPSWSYASYQQGEAGDLDTPSPHISVLTNGRGMMALIEDIDPSTDPKAVSSATDMLDFYLNELGETKNTLRDGTAEEKLGIVVNAVKLAASKAETEVPGSAKQLSVSVVVPIMHENKPMLLRGKLQASQELVTGEASDDTQLSSTHQSFKEIKDVGTIVAIMTEIHDDLRVVMGSQSVWHNKAGEKHSETNSRVLHDAQYRPTTDGSVRSLLSIQNGDAPRAIVVSDYRPDATSSTKEKTTHFTKPVDLPKPDYVKQAEARADEEKPSKLRKAASVLGKAAVVGVVAKGAAQAVGRKAKAVKQNHSNKANEATPAKTPRRKKIAAGAGAVAAGGAGLAKAGYNKARTTGSKFTGHAGTRYLKIRQAQAERASNREKPTRKQAMLAYAGAFAIVGAAVLIKDFPGTQMPGDFFKHIDGFFGGGSGGGSNSNGGSSSTGGETGSGHGGYQYDGPIGPGIDESSKGELKLSPNVLVEQNHGYTQEITDTLAKKGIHLTPQQSYDAYQHLGTALPDLKGNYFESIDSYRSHGEFRISHPGHTTWNPAALEELRRFIEENDLDKKKS